MRGVLCGWKSPGPIAYHPLHQCKGSLVCVRFTMILALEVRRSVMKVCRAGKVRVAFLGVSCLALVWTQAAQAQVKLEHKYPEGQKLTYKTTSKTHQTLTLMGMEI